MGRCKMIMPVKILVIYGLLMLVGGWKGYKAGSKVSFWMGMISTIIIFLCIFMAQKGYSGAYTFLFIYIAFLTGMFLSRLLKTKKFMPSGMLLLFSLIALAACSVLVF